MMISELEPAYEAARSWALQPVSHPPPGWAHMVRYGLATWMRERQPSVRQAAPEIAPLKGPDCSGLLTIVAAMIGEVCQ
jgi:hypothetical protein